MPPRVPPEVPSRPHLSAAGDAPCTPGRPFRTRLPPVVPVFRVHSSTPPFPPKPTIMTHGRSRYPRRSSTSHLGRPPDAAPNRHPPSPFTLARWLQSHHK